MENMCAGPVIKNILERRSIRRYLPQPVEREKLLCVLEAMRYAPSGHNNQYWHFTAISNADILAELCRLVREAFRKRDPEANKHMADAIRAAQRDDYRFIYTAPCLIVTSITKDYLNAMADCSCAQENAMLAASAIGLASCWVNQLHWLDDDKDLRTFLSGYGVPLEHTICGSVIIGYSAYTDTPKALPRKENTFNIVE